MKDDAGIKLFFDPQGGLLYSFENEDLLKRTLIVNFLGPLSDELSYFNYQLANFLKENSDNRSFLFDKDGLINDIFERLSFEEAKSFF